TAAAPIRGGILGPTLYAEASGAAANSSVSPAFFIIGMGGEQAATVSPRELPETVRCTALPDTAPFAVPPVYRPVRATPKSFKICPILVCTKITPKNKNRKINLADIWIGVPKTPLSWNHKLGANRLI